MSDCVSEEPCQWLSVLTPIAHQTINNCTYNTHFESGEGHATRLNRQSPRTTPLTIVNTHRTPLWCLAEFQMSLA
eukprot:1686433-Amphidinium_carterae.1